VAILQFMNHGTDGSFFVYAVNDFYHFFLNLIMAAGWGFEAGYSFNGPAWSLSVEVFVYGLFFVLSRRMRPGFVACVSLAFLALLAVFPLMARQIFFYKVCLGAGFFLLGGAAYAATRKLTMASAKVRNCVYWTCCMAWSVVGLKNFGISLLPTSISSQLGSLLSSGFPVGLFFSTVLTLALWEIHASEKSILLLKRFSWIGDISFSVYLLHFPLQLVCHMATVRLGMAGRPWSDWRFLMGFLVGCVLLSRLSFTYFEVPMRGWIRRRYGKAPGF
jgi:peptidoglycan/LPS O-acetylase OafA/YrhL